MSGGGGGSMQLGYFFWSVGSEKQNVKVIPMNLEWLVEL